MGCPCGRRALFFISNLEFGIGESTDRHGHWRDRKGEIEKDLISAF